MARLRRFISSRAALAAVLLGIARAAAAQTPVSLAELLPVDTAVRTGRLANGLTYYIRHNGVPGKRAELRLVVNAGSALEDDDQKGVAHLLEHLAFDGSTHFPGHEMWDYLERLGMRGGADVNASTSFDETVYRIAIPTDSAEILTRGLQMLGDWMHGLALDSAELERERKVVVEEWRVREGAASRISTQQLAVIAPGSPYPDHTPMQPADVMARASLAAVRRFYHDWYRPDLMAVVIVGDVDPAALEARVRRMYSAIPAPAHPRPRPAITVPVDSAPRISVVTDAEATATSVTVLVTRPAVPERTVGDVRRGIVAQAADAMLTARLTDLAHQAGAPMLDVAMGHGSIVRPLAFHQFSARAADGGVERALRALLAEAARVQRSGFTATELERQTRAIRLSYDQLEAQRDRIPSATYADRLVNEFLTGAPAVPLERAVAIGRRLVSTITLDDVRRALADLVAGPGRIILVSAPAAATALPSVAELRAALDTAPPTLGVYVDSATTAPLLAHPPAPGHIAAVQRVDSVGIQIWTLSNGVRVILKPTTFDANDVQVTSYRDGGTSYAPDSMLVPALTALPLVSQSGLGPYDAAALKKRLAGTSVAGGGMIGPFGEGLWGRSAPKDLTTLFQLLYLQFTAPRLDSSVFEQYAATLRDAVAHRAVSPEAAFSDTLDVVLADHSPRVRLLDDAYLRELDRAKSLAFFKQRFADATGFTFVIVGAFTVDSIKPLVERYLGGLPAAGARSTWRDTGLRRPDGIVTRVVRKGKEPKSAVTLVFLGPADRSRRERAVLTALGEVLRRRLWERLRQELGGVYGVSVTTQEEVVPTATSLVTVSFGADPARLAELTHEVFATITDLRRAGPTAAELATYKAEYRRARESEVRSNAFWIEAIALYDQRGWPLADVPTADRLVESITIADLAAAARRYLDLSHYVQVSLLPETPAS